MLSKKMMYEKPTAECFGIEQLHLLAAMSVDAGIQEFESDDEVFVN